MTDVASRAAVAGLALAGLATCGAVVLLEGPTRARRHEDVPEPL